MPEILLIEDDTLVRNGIEDVLQVEGYNFLAAQDGLLGVQMAQIRKPDLIICDINMPELDGYAVLSALRSDPLTRHIPFIFLTGRIDRADVRQGMDLGADDYLTKPFTASELTHAIRSRLERQTAALAPLQQERERAHILEKQIQASREMVELKARLLDKLLEELRTPLSNINMALSMLERARSEEERDRYVRILRQEYSREVALLTEVSNLQEFTNSNGGSVGSVPIGFLNRLLSKGN